MRLPHNLNIRGIEYRIIEVPFIDPKTVNDGEKDDIICGAWDFWKSTIEIRYDLPPARKRINLMHEILHSVTEGMGLTEDQIDYMAWDLCDTLRRNRSLRRLFTRSLWRRIVGLL